MKKSHKHSITLHTGEYIHNYLHPRGGIRAASPNIIQGLDSVILHVSVIMRDYPDLEYPPSGWFFYF